MPNFNPLNPTKFLGTNKYITFFVSRNRRPTGADYRQPETGTLYSVGTVWQVGKNPTTGTEGELWMLSKIVANVATWIQLQANVEILEQFTTNLGGPVVPDVNDNIFVNASVTTFTDGTVANTLKTEVQGTDHALFVGRGTNLAAANLGVGTTGFPLIGATGADPQFAAIGTNSNLTGIVLGNGNSPFTTIDYVPIDFWTPTVVGSAVPGATTYTVQSGSFYRIGNLVLASFSVVWTATTGVGDLIITGWPYKFGGAQPRAPICSVWPDNMTWPAGTAYFVGFGQDNTTEMILEGIRNGAVSQHMQMQATGTIEATIVYFTSDPV